MIIWLIVTLIFSGAVFAEIVTSRFKRPVLGYGDLEREVLGSWSEPPEPFELAVARIALEQAESNKKWADWRGATLASSNFTVVHGPPFEAKVQWLEDAHRANEAVLVKRGLDIVRGAIPY